ncbi:MAG: peptidylprolyl isomerase [Chitinophagales bacterium]
MKKIIIAVLCIATVSGVYAQQVIDKVVAQVGDKIILKSDVEAFYQDELQKGDLPEDYRCRILQELITQKLLLIQAAKDSIEVSEDEVESNLDNRIRHFIQLFGSQEKMEAFYGKSVQEIKEEFRDDLRNLLLIQRMQDQIFDGLSVSPSEVKAFYASIPQDSLPLINAEVSYAQIVIVPKPNTEQKAIARAKAEDIRQRILNGEDFCKLVDLYSLEKDNCGYLGCNTRETYVTEFSAAAFRLKPGEISEVVETQFGYHIIKMDDRQGDKACLRHILIQPPVTNINITATTKELDSLRTELNAGKLTFCEAATKYSTDENSNRTCGVVMNPQTGENTFEIGQLSPDDYYAIENLKPGEMSKPLTYTTERGEKAVRVVKLISQTEPHVINLQDDYAKLQNAALSRKQMQIMEAWVLERVKTEFIQIDPSFSDCDFLELLQASNN